jgi:hypothetical protein
MHPLTRRVLALLELDPALARLGLPAAVLKVNRAWHGRPLSHEQLRAVCRHVWLTRRHTHEEEAGTEESETDLTALVMTRREPVL